MNPARLLDYWTSIIFFLELEDRRTWKRFLNLGWLLEDGTCGIWTST
jgi:hypothetical protein